jgi:hypothetical protein
VNTVFIFRFQTLHLLDFKQFFKKVLSFWDENTKISLWGIYILNLRYFLNAPLILRVQVPFFFHFTAILVKLDILDESI